MIDLHCHSHFSDGQHSPQELLDMAIRANVEILALTDHDTIDGLPSLHAAVNNLGVQIKIINGIELSVRWKKYELHILGLNVNIQAEQLNDLITKQAERRTLRALEIGSRLETVGIQNAYEKAVLIAGHENVARPHYAQLLINEGFTRTLQEGFKRYLGKGRGAYIPTPWAEIEEAVKVINESQGQAVIAHPLKYALTRTKLHELIRAFKVAGGAGIEVISGVSTQLQANELAGLCQRYDLLASSGSDFHNETNSWIRLGRQRALPLNCTPIWQKWTN